MTIGTASTMTSVAEVLGFSSLVGAPSAIPAVDSNHARWPTARRPSSKWCGKI